MERLIKYMRDDFAPKVQKFADNPWVSSLQASMLTGLPLVLVGSLVTMFSLLRNIFPNFPDISMLSTFSFGLFGLVVAFLLPYFILEKKGHNDKRIIAGLTSMSLFLMLAKPIFEENEVIYILARLGSQGMFVAIIGGILVGFIMNFAASRSFFDEDSLVPDFVKGWFDSLLPITLILMIGWLVVGILNFDAFDAITKLFEPLGGLLNSFWGFVLIGFIYVFIYSFGISGWVLFGATYPIMQANLAANMNAIAAGDIATHIAVQETNYALIFIGGTGSTLALAIMLAFLSKSQRLKAIGRASLAPSIFNINEPLVYGAPIMFNPILMIPFWICGAVIPALAYLTMSLGLVNIPTQTYLLWYVPYPLTSYFATQDYRAIIACLILFAITWIIYYPFFRVYDQQIIKEELELEKINQMEENYE